MLPSSSATTLGIVFLLQFFQAISAVNQSDGNAVFSHDLAHNVFGHPPLASMILPHLSDQDLIQMRPVSKIMESAVNHELAKRCVGRIIHFKKERVAIAGIPQWIVESLVEDGSLIEESDPKMVLMFGSRSPINPLPQVLRKLPYLCDGLRVLNYDKKCLDVSRYDVGRQWEVPEDVNGFIFPAALLARPDVQVSVIWPQRRLATIAQFPGYTKNLLKNNTEVKALNIKYSLQTDFGWPVNQIMKGAIILSTHGILDEAHTRANDMAALIEATPEGRDVQFAIGPSIKYYEPGWEPDILFEMYDDTAVILFGGDGVRAATFTKHLCKNAQENEELDGCESMEEMKQDLARWKDEIDEWPESELIAFLFAHGSANDTAAEAYAFRSVFPHIPLAGNVPSVQPVDGTEWHRSVTRAQQHGAHLFMIVGFQKII